MKSIFLTVAAASAFAAAAPAAAQYRYGSHAGDGLFESRAEQVEERIDEAGRNGALTHYQTAGLRNRLWELRRLERTYSRDGLTDWERSDLRARLAEIERQVGGAYGGYRDERYDRDGNGYDDRTDRDGNGYDDLLDSDGNGYDDRYDRNGDGVDDGPADPEAGAVPGYDPYGYEGGAGAPDDRGYDGSMLGDDRTSGEWDDNDGVLPAPRNDSSGYDTDERSGALRVGDVAPAGLDPVPPQWSSLYPDGGGVYYRYEDGQVLQIERSTNVIRWIGTVQ